MPRYPTPGETTLWPLVALRPRWAEELRESTGLVIEREVSSGGMSHVLRASGEGGRLRAIVKVARSGPQEQERLRREGEALERLRHPAVVRLLGRGEIEGEPYLVLEHVEGPTLATFLASEGPRPLRVVAALVVRVAEALAAAHVSGIVHRDVKPSNILLPGGAPAEAKLIDFGIAAAPNPAKLTREGLSPGTPGYMAPEHVAGLPAGPAADQFGLATVAFEALTGRRALDGAVFSGEEVDWRAVRSSIPPAVEAVLRRALARAPEERYANVSAFADAFRRACVEETLPGRLRLPARLSLHGIMLILAADVVLRLCYGGLDGALRGIVDEPSKSIFDLFLLPVALAILGARFPRRAWRRVLPADPVGTVAALVLLLSCSLLVTIDDARESVCTRLSVPEDIADPGLRRRLLELRRPRDGGSEARRRAYAEALADARGDHCAYFNLASARAVLAATVTGFGNAMVGILFFLLYLRARAPGAFLASEANGLLVVAGLLACWSPLRLIADFNENFGRVGFEAYGQWTPIIALGTIPPVLILIADRSAKAACVCALLLGSSVVPVSAYVFEPRWLFAALAWWSSTRPIHLMMILTIVAFVMAAVARRALMSGVSRDETVSAPS